MHTHVTIMIKEDEEINLKVGTWKDLARGDGGWREQRRKCGSYILIRMYNKIKCTKFYKYKTVIM